MKIYVIRHGQSQANADGIIADGDTPLTQLGIEEAKNAAQSLPSTIKHFYVSTFNRAKHTADILNEGLNVPVTFHDELKEVSFGELEGTPYLDEYKEKHRAQAYDWRPSGESFDEVKERVLKVLEKIKNESNDEEALIVAHGGIIRLLHFLESDGGVLDDVGNISLHSFDLDKILS